MSLDKKRQTYLLNWLKQNANAQKALLRLSVLTGFALACMIIIQAALFAIILQKLIIEQVSFASVSTYIIGLVVVFFARALLIYLREKINFSVGVSIRQSIRRQVINHLENLGPAYINHHTTGSWSTLLIEQVDNLQNFYAHYLPQMRLAMMVPILIFISILPLNWAAALILLCTAPLIPLFMVLVGMGAADVNRRNFKALSYLSGHFLDRLKGLKTIRLFNQGDRQTEQIHNASEDFRIKTMQVLKMAFLSSAVLEFFTSISIAVVAVYFGFSYLGEFEFGAYNGAVTLFAGFFVLILAPEFFQPLRDLGTFYHAKAEAIASADNLDAFLKQQQDALVSEDKSPINHIDTIEADNLIVLSSTQDKLVGPLSFQLKTPFNLALIGTSGEGKTSLVNALMGFLPYQGSLKINGTELRQLDLMSWQQHISWIGQNPYLLNGSIRENLLLANPSATDKELDDVLVKSQLDNVISRLPQGLDTEVGEDAVRLSVGQAQRIAIARAMLKPCQLIILDEPTASLDKQTVSALKLHNIASNSITITHKLADNADYYDVIWQLEKNAITIKKPLC